MESEDEFALRSDKYDCIWFAESRSHMALMSPVITKVNSSAELLAATPFHLIAVSAVLGYEFTNNRARSGSTIVVFSLVSVASKSDELNVRQC